MIAVLTRDFTTAEPGLMIWLPRTAALVAEVTDCWVDRAA